jgi:integrase
MPRKQLTVPFVEKIRPPTDKPQEDYFDTVLPAFGLRVGQRRKTWFVMVRTLRNGTWKLQRTTLGTTAEMDLAKARESARAAIERAQQGKAPIEIKRERRETQRAESRNTFASVRADFLKLYRTRQKRAPSASTLHELRRVLESDLFSDWNERPLAKITKQDIMDVTDCLVKQGKEVAANRYLAYLRIFFKWAKKRDIIKDNPAADVEKPGIEQSRARVLTPGELRAIWQATAPTQANKGDLFASIIKTLMLTGQRAGEVSGMRWSEIDLDARLWTLPGDRTKNHHEHLVPLSTPVVEILRERKADQAAMGMNTPLVFTSTGKAPFSGWSKSKARLDGRAKVDPWTLHDLRRTLVTRMAEDLRTPPHIVEAVVNHVSGAKAGIAGIYNRAQHLDERRSALNAWADYVLRLVGEVEADNVVEITL